MFETPKFIYGVRLPTAYFPLPPHLSPKGFGNVRNEEGCLSYNYLLDGDVTVFYPQIVINVPRVFTRAKNHRKRFKFIFNLIKYQILITYLLIATELEGNERTYNQVGQ